MSSSETRPLSAPEKPKHRNKKVSHRLPNGEVDEIFDFWKAQTGRSKARLDDKRRRLITARLKDGYSKLELGNAILGCSADDFHGKGINDRNRRYDDIALICRDAAHVDQFLDIAKRKGLEAEE